MMYWDDGHGDGGWMAVLMILTTLAVLAVIGFLAWWSLRSGPSAPNSAEQLLGERLARGEIDEADYSSRLQALRQAHPR